MFAFQSNSDRQCLIERLAKVFTFFKVLSQEVNKVPNFNLREAFLLSS